ncbi:hypothetical protein D3C80_1904200 [compost metagenome]
MAVTTPELLAEKLKIITAAEEEAAEEDAAELEAALAAVVAAEVDLTNNDNQRLMA